MNSRATDRPEPPLLRQMVGSPTVRETLTNALYAAREITARGSDIGGNGVDSGSELGGGSVSSGTTIESGDASHASQPASAHQSAHMTHAWLFTGPPGAGRSVAAKAFAASLMCKEETPGCGQCEACRTALAGTHTDIVTIVPEGVVIPVKQVRDMIEAASRMPTTAQWRVVIVEDADRLNDAGANALLKSIEEPPPRTVFILCAPSTDPDDVHVTIRSRCRHVYIPTPSIDEVKHILADDTALGLTDKQIDWAASVSGGHVGRAKRLASDEQARTQRQRALRVPEKVYQDGAAYLYTGELVASAKKEAEAATAERDEAELAKLREALGVGAKGRGAAKAQRGSAGAMKELETKQKNRRTRMVIDLLDLSLMDIAGLYRDALMVSVNAGGGGVPAIHPDHANTAAELARRNTPEQLLQCVDAVRMGRELLASGVRQEGALDAMVGRLRQICVTGPVD
ncbi:DNA polymerase III subunit delta' [Corynebacterium pseudokroppenstedtii]|uniref:DNA polymerase III subunit delta n=1 Tax=Corynebacterium pseudokroppenstedtii TaxID=2804917 RepID=A0AAU0PWR4_9CORY|nr:DNA polymerase III subunit delta' [Corynebacterium pseudokroppenstedtii]QRP14277.1 DNA polymerase III subunit delta' [Corynebacterium kroppenstedtii]MBY0790417.1 DNA polymerase III subunit delta' [Corynebacterium pseudokroppenstedtii]MCF6793040.1 DNA polymerase III subunit delta' [Corynebacterium pseudokroppenstedtii]MCF8702163.1 DNA polymerase III subunit delta' [Corynebacterium pseudokroppenstedtii]MCG2635693.1 DNA polymerase III subunit delta' [Corynebacterium pseudokroppenstedtii]